MTKHAISILSYELCRKEGIKNFIQMGTGTGTAAGGKGLRALGDG